MTEKNYRIRRAIVAAMSEYVLPQCLDNLYGHEKMLEENPAPDAARREWDALIDAGILEAIRGYKGEYCRLAPAFRKMIDDGLSLTRVEALYGPAALR